MVPVIATASKSVVERTHHQLRAVESRANSLVAKTSSDPVRIESGHSDAEHVTKMLVKMPFVDKSFSITDSYKALIVPGDFSRYPDERPR